MLLDIVILPPARLRERIGRNISEAAKGLDSGFIVDNKKLIPHLSLFHIRTSTNRIRNLESRIREILRKYRPIEIRSTAVMLSPSGSGIVYIETTNPQVLKKLRLEVFAASYPLRTGPMPWFSKHRKPTREEKTQRQKYGTHLRFHPHFTLAMFQNVQDAEKVVRNMKFGKFRFLADTIAIAEVNFWHQVTRVIKKFKLK